MKILHDLLSTINTDADVLDIRQGVFHTGVLTRFCGLASTLPRDALCQQPPLVKTPGHLLEKSARELADMAFSSSILEAAIGMAAVNSMLHVDISACRELNARELIMAKGKGKRVAIVGHFPFIAALKKTAKKLWVIEKNPREEDFTEADAPRLLPQAEVVAITGSAFTNHTIGKLLTLCRPNAFVVVLGDTAPLSPILFDYGIDAVCGTVVSDHSRALSCISQGANFRQIRGTQRLTMTK
jgi:hypothetical protein